MSSPIRRRSTRQAALVPLALAGAFALAAPAAADPAAHLEVEAIGTQILDSSAFGAQSYRLRNDGSQPITGLRIDLGAGPAMFPDIVFDPAGEAGNDTGKPFTVDIVPAGVTATAVYGGGSDAEGYLILDVDIQPGLAPGQELKFSIDTDPTVVRDSFPGPHGKISGAEHHGATVTVTYGDGDGTVQVNDLAKSVGSDIKSAVDLPAAAAVAPGVTVAGVTAPAVVSSPAQTVTLTGPAGANGILLVAEGHLYLAGQPGFDVDPFEANVLVGYAEYPFSLGADGTAELEVTLTRRMLSDVPGAQPGEVSAEIGRNYITAWLTGATGASGPVSTPLVLEWDGTPLPPGVDPPPPPPPAPPTPGASDTPATLLSVPEGPLGLDNCAPTDAPAAGGGVSGRVGLSAAQLRINQRIGQAAIRRLNAIQEWLDAGVVGRDLCGGTLGPREFGAGLTQAPGSAPTPARARPRPLKVASPGGAGTIVLSSAQLRINQRIYRAALLRARALDTRLRGRLTGGDVRDGSLGDARFAVPVRVGAAGGAPKASVTTPVSLTDTGGAITLSAAQLRINQRIGQRAVREANSLRRRIERGLTGVNFSAGSITAVDLAPTD